MAALLENVLNNCAFPHVLSLCWLVAVWPAGMLKSSLLLTLQGFVSDYFGQLIDNNCDPLPYANVSLLATLCCTVLCFFIRIYQFSHSQHIYLVVLEDPQRPHLL